MAVGAPRSGESSHQDCRGRTGDHRPGSARGRRRPLAPGRLQPVRAADRGERRPRAKGLEGFPGTLRVCSCCSGGSCCCFRGPGPQRWTGSGGAWGGRS